MGVGLQNEVDAVLDEAQKYGDVGVGHEGGSGQFFGLLRVAFDRVEQGFDPVLNLTIIRSESSPVLGSRCTSCRSSLTSAPLSKVFPNHYFVYL